MFCFILFKSSSIHLSEFNYKLVTDEITLLFLFFFYEKVGYGNYIKCGFCRIYIFSLCI